MTREEKIDAHVRAAIARYFSGMHSLGVDQRLKSMVQYPKEERNGHCLSGLYWHVWQTWNRYFDVI